MILSLALALAVGPVTPSDTLARDSSASGLVVVHRQPSLPLVALRLSLVADDPPGLAGAGHLQQHLVFPRLREAAERVGGQAEVLRTSDALVYTVAGPAAELTYLARILRSALVLPTVGTGAMLAASNELAEERAAEWETAPAHVRMRLRAGLFPDELSPAGNAASARRLNAASLVDAWAAMYRPERVAVVAVGDVEPRAVREVFGVLPTRAEAISAGGEGRDTVAAAPPGPAEATRAWLGLGYPAAEIDPAAVTVAVRLLQDRLRTRLPAAQLQVEHWWTHRGQAVAIVAGVPGPEMDAAGRVLDAALAGVGEALTDAEVRRAADAVRRDLLFYARTPARMAALVGQFVDRSGDPQGAQRFHDALAAVDADRLRAVLDALAASPPVRVALPPQALKTGR